MSRRGRHVRQPGKCSGPRRLPGIAAIILEYLDVVRFDGCAGRTPYELIHAAHRLGNLAGGAPSNIECKYARYGTAVFEVAQFAVVPIGLR